MTFRAICIRETCVFACIGNSALSTHRAKKNRIYAIAGEIVYRGERFYQLLGQQGEIRVFARVDCFRRIEPRSTNILAFHKVLYECNRSAEAKILQKRKGKAA